MNQHFDLSIYQNIVANPLVPMTLRIGVAGHRTLPADQLPRLREEIHAIYTTIDQAVQAIFREEAATWLYGRETPIIRIISSLAEGLTDCVLSLI